VPADDEAFEPARRGARVALSAPSELIWLVMILLGWNDDAEGDRIRAAHPDLAERAAAFWGDGMRLWYDVLVVANATGTLLTDDVDGLLGALVAPLPAIGDLTLETEAERDRVIIRDRVARLRAEPALRSAYADLLGAIWTAAAVDWGTRGAREATVVARALTVRLAAGDAVAELLAAKHIARRDAYVPLVDAALARGEVVVTPLWFATGGHLIALPGLLAVGLAVSHRDSATLRRAHAAEIAGRLKVLSDPTRVAILSQFACGAMTVSDVAREFGLAQPTVSIHLRQLRDAGLVEPRREGGRTVYTVPPGRLEALLRETGDQLLRFCDR
jgi:DNA-binding transcriptional ArsR family regulator